MKRHTAIFWFRRDLRLADNPALHHALSHFNVIPVYLHCPDEQVPWMPGAASRWWLHHSLNRLNESLGRLGSKLVIRQGENAKILLNELIEESGSRAVFWNRLYTPTARQRDQEIKSYLRDHGIEAESFNASLIHDPWVILKKDKTPYRVFTAWWVKMVETGLKCDLLPAPKSMSSSVSSLKTLAIESLGLLSDHRWHAKFDEQWQTGEQAAQQQVKHMFRQVIDKYATQRDRPDVSGTSRLSPYLHFGEISPRQVLNELLNSIDAPVTAKGKSSAERFAAELGWRDFSAYLLYHFPDTVDRPLNRQFENFAWAKQYKDELMAWQEGRTGIPIVDAGMRELWATGWMHNRVRMIVASFLTKNLLIPWQEGADWFWDCLVDADLASNTMGWQWVAGCGADAAPYFRIFNPVLQGEKFDPEGLYIKKWIPEMAEVPDKYLHQPWVYKAAQPEHAVSKYPAPIVDLKESRERALQAYRKLSS